MTETRPEAETSGTAAPPAAVATRREVPGVAGWLSTSDHKRIARLWIGAALLLLLVGGVLGGILSVERIDPGLDVLSTGTFGQVYTLHGEVGVFLFLLPLMVGLATFVVPLQVGATDVAFPRGAATAFWAYLVSAGIFLAAYAVDGGAGGGDAVGVDLYLLSLASVVVATSLALVCVLTTAFTLRAPGMSLARTPLFTWSVIVGGGLTLLTSPVLVARLIGLFVDHHFTGSFGDHDSISWFWSVPQLYLIVVPVLGIALETAPVTARVATWPRAAGMALVGAFGILAVGAWAQTPDSRAEPLHMAVSAAVVLPTLGLLGIVGETLRRGRPALRAPFAMAAAALLVLLLGVLAGAVLVMEPLDLTGTTWATGQVHLVLYGAGTLGGLAGLWWWAPKIWGVRLSEAAGYLVLLLTLLGALLLAGPELVNGIVDEVPQGVADFDDADLTVAMGAVSAGGAALAVLGALLAVAAVVGQGLRKGEPVADDPWNGHTLEWSTSSPPPPGNFTEPVPPVRSATPLLEPAGEGS